MAAPPSTNPARDTLSIREAAGRLLARRPDLGSHRQQRRRARQIADSIGMRVAPADVLAGWLGSNADADVRDLDVALEDRVKLRLAALSPRDREAADTPRLRARIALDLGWEQLQGHGPREVLRILALLGGGPVARELVEDAAGVGTAATSDVVWAGFARLDEQQDLLSAHPDVLDHLASQPDSKAAADGRPRRFVLAVRERLVGGEPEDSRLDLAAEQAATLADQADQPALVASIAHRQGDRLRRRSMLDESRAWLDRGYAATQRQSATALRGILEMDYGLLELHVSNVPAAIRHFEAAIEGIAAADLAGVPGTDAAMEHARLLLGESLAAAGQLSRAEGELADVVRCLQRRWNEYSTDGDDGPANSAKRRSLAVALAHAFRSLGTVQLLRGDVSGALIHLQEAREDWHDIAGGDAPEGAAFALVLARALRAAGRFNEVEEPLEAARLLAGGDMDRPARAALPVALHDFGVAARDRGDTASAATLLDEATMLAASILPKAHPLRGRIMYTRALLYLAENDLGRAVDSLDETAKFELDDVLQALIDAARGWAIAQEGAHRYRDAEELLETAEEALGEARGASSMGAAHVHLLRRSLRG